MSDERRYSDEEIAAIFEQAAEAQEAAQRSRPHREGLTLAELQEIGRETGITSEFIARAATRIDRTPRSEPRTTLLGLPVGVARTVAVPGPLSDAEWDRLVVDLRATFQAAGEVRRDGSLREWRNGNLHVLAEPTESGHRLHFRTRKGNAQQSLTLSFFFLLIGAVFLSLFAAQGASEPGMMAIMSLFVAAGLSGTGITAYQLPRWAERRERQMEAIAARAVERASTSPAAAADREAGGSDPLGLDALPDAPEDEPRLTPRRTRT
jgi:hypothetical protein